MTPHLHRRGRRRTFAALVLGAVATSALSAPAVASSGDDDREIRVSGACKAGATWNLRARDDDGRIEIRGEVDHTPSGQAWFWKVKHNGSISAQGRTVTRLGRLEVERSLVDLAGTDVCVFRAVNERTGEVCRGTIDW